VRSVVIEKRAYGFLEFFTFDASFFSHKTDDTNSLPCHG